MREGDPRCAKQGCATSLIEPRPLHHQGLGTLGASGSAFPLIGDAAQGTATLTADFNGDERADVIVTYDDVPSPTRDLRNRLFFGSAGGNFVLASKGSTTERSTGGALGDFDGDGDLDLFVANRDSPDHLLRNDLIK